MRKRLLEKLDWKLFMLVSMIFFLSYGEALPQKKGDFVRNEQVIDYAIALAGETYYKQDSDTISISIKGGQIIVRFDPMSKDPPGKVTHGGALEIYFKEVEGGYEYVGGLKY